MVFSVEKADDDSSLFEEGTYLASQHAFKHLGQRLWQEGVLSFDCAIQFRCLCMNGDPTLSLHAFFGVDSFHSDNWTSLNLSRVKSLQSAKINTPCPRGRRVLNACVFRTLPKASFSVRTSQFLRVGLLSPFACKTRKRILWRVAEIVVGMCFFGLHSHAKA
ncbi:hypothetical protein CEXT_634751 [Caerostris extrusa]|uniref:Uncharacterized protein n=1 Tax=Caerostris extrusa TaxID=172846 RepID=A0AAV4PAA0_CAEEX|nr:hypothetical protein CEXT_634751 [Caerostris extrusa]